jgi:hypothetical protein
MAKQNQNTPKTEQEQIDAWKQQYGEGNIFCVSVAHKNVNPDTKLKAYIKKPSLVTMSKIARYGEEHINKALEVFLEDSYLGGDPEIEKYDEYKVAVFQKAMPMFEVPEADIVKL